MGGFRCTKPFDFNSEAVVICSGKDLDFAPISRLPSVAIAGQTSLAVGNKKAGGLKTALDQEGYITPVYYI